MQTIAVYISWLKPEVTVDPSISKILSFGFNDSLKEGQIVFFNIC